MCFYRRNGQQIFHYTTDVKKLKLMVNVSNVPSQDRKAEDAYSAFLNVTIPTSLSFSSLNPKVRSKDVLRNYTLVPSTVLNTQSITVSHVIVYIKDYLLADHDPDLDPGLITSGNVSHKLI